MPDDVGSGAWKFLVTQSDVLAALGAYPANDPSFPNQPFLFTANILVTMKGQSASACVVSDAGGWDVPPILGSQRFRRLRVDVYTDPLRDANLNIAATQKSTLNRCLQVFAVLHRHLQRKDSDIQQWGDLITYGCQLLTEPQPVEIPDGDSRGMGVLLGSAVYGVGCGGWTDFPG